MGKSEQELQAEADRMAEEYATPPTVEAFTGLHEEFLMLQQAGFTLEEALWIISYILVGGQHIDQNNQGGLIE